MANSLNINLANGQKVVMHGVGSEKDRTVEVIGGFGQMSFTSGTALIVKFSDGSTGRMNSQEIEKLTN